LGDFEQVIWRGFETLRGSARNYLKISDLRESREDFLLNTIGKVGVVRIVAQVFEWKNRNRFCCNLCRPALSIALRIAPEEKQTYRDRARNNYDINPHAIALWFFWQFVCELRSLQALRRQLKRPRDHESNRKTNHNQHYHQPDCPVWNLEERKNLRRYLHQQPCDDCVGDSDFVNIAPLQLSEEVLRVHGDVLCSSGAVFFGGKTFATRASKRGSPRSGSRKGSTL